MNGEVGEVAGREFGRRLRLFMRLKLPHARLEGTWSRPCGRARLVGRLRCCRVSQDRVVDVQYLSDIPYLSPSVPPRPREGQKPFCTYNSHSRTVTQSSQDGEHTVSSAKGSGVQLSLTAPSTQ